MWGALLSGLCNRGHTTTGYSALPGIGYCLVVDDILGNMVVCYREIITVLDEDMKQEYAENSSGMVAVIHAMVSC